MADPGSTGGTERTTDEQRESPARLVAVALVALVVIAAALGLAATRSDDRDTRTRTESSAAPAGGPDAAPIAAGDPSSAPGSPRAASPSTQAPAPAKITMAFAGDLLPHGPVNAKAARYASANGAAYDYAPMLAPMAKIIGGADVAICHLEVPVAPPGEAVTSYPSFGSPAELVDGAKSAGYDGCSNASNHSLDRGRAGIAATLDRFDQDQLHHAGTARTQDEANTITTYQAGGATVAHLSYAYGFNGYQIPADAPWAVNEIDPARIEADAARARADGADLVVVSLHWGIEYDHQPSAYQRQIADALLPSPNIDLVIGHHAHVVQPIEQVDGTFVVYGLGNQLSNMTQGPRRDGLTVVATATKEDGRWRFTGIEAVPTYVDLATFRVLPVAETLADPATPPGLRDELSASYDRTATVLFPTLPAGVTIDPRP